MRPAFLLAAVLIRGLQADVTVPAPGSNTEPTPFSETASAVIEHQVAALNAVAVQKGNHGDYRGAVAVLEGARRLCAPPAVTSPGFYARLLANLAEGYEQLSDWNHALVLLHTAADLDEQSLGVRDLRTVRVEVRLASAEVVVGRLNEADPRLRSALAALRANPASAQGELVCALNALALLDLNLNRLPEAERFASEAVALDEAGDAAGADYASTLSVLGTVYVAERRQARALPLLNRAIALTEQLLAPDHPRIAPMLIERGLVEESGRKFALAEQDIQRAITMFDRTGDPSAVNSDWARFRLAVLYMDEHKLPEADEVLEPAVERQRKFFGAANLRLACCIRQLARLRQMEKRYDEAMSLYREAIIMMVAVRSAGHAPVSIESAALENRPASEKEVRRIAARANEVFRAAE